MLVGHEPDFSNLIAFLTGGRVKISKAGLALLELKKGKGELRWLLPAKLGRL
jgi:phosphohistidine phosphatase SixA